MIVKCKACGQKNRVPASHLHEVGRCGRCRADLGPVDAPIAVVDVAHFDELVGGAGVPVLIDFWADWCGPCRTAAPHVAATASSWAGRALVLKVDTEALPELAARYGVQGIPNFVVLRGGRVVHQQAGAVDAATLQGWLWGA